MRDELFAPSAGARVVMLAFAVVLLLVGCRQSGTNEEQNTGGPQQILPPGPVPCVSSEQCPFGQTCEDGWCATVDLRPGDDGCVRDSDCEAGLRCAVSTGNCVSPADYPEIPDDDPEHCVEGERRFCGSKIGACEYGTEDCFAGAFSGICLGGVGPAAELCDGIDNDCDGETDEDFLDLGNACKAGTGVCQVTGERVCSATGSGTTCGAVAAQPQTDELCGNRLDDDCDGEIDEGFQVGQACSAGRGVCSKSGTLACSADGTTTQCDAVPLPPDAFGERCGNGLDDDCDGETDEGFPPGGACTVGLGACQRTGLMVCNSDGTGLACNASPGTPGAAELCGNGIDDDCDGQVDEGFDNGAACSNGVGACSRPGVKVCAADGLSTLCGAMPGNPDPSGERCGNLVDDDCDGIIDEGFDVGAACSNGLGICQRPGAKVCTADGLGTRCSATPGNPAAAGELCGNGLDDDCDGQSDEGYAVGAVCTVGVGACSTQGITVCTSDALGVMCNATAGQSADELCGNSLDDDCDGEVDEGFDEGSVCSVGTGACTRTGVKVCRADGVGTQCSVTAEAPATGGELCGNGIDDDCDGSIDEGFDVGTACNVGVGVCARSGVKACSADGRTTTCNAAAGPPNAAGELCGNGQDDDCDGEVDEGFTLGAACTVGTGVCGRTGITVCSTDRRTTTCNVTPGNPNGGGELCGNGLDDDCDGQADEGFDVGTFCSTGVGACAGAGTKVCTPDGQGTMCNATSGEPAGERCGNGTDDDCDGRIDEGFDVGAACSAGVGICARPGVKVCRADGLGTECGSTPGAPDPQGEVCGNGLDDDCDGEVDEGFDVGLSCSVGTGACVRWGVKACSADGRATTCDAEAASPNAQGEVCGNGLDDDCDGQVDEGYDVGTTCNVGTGTCQRSGTKVCRADGLGTQCNAVPGSPNGAGELCGNGLDDDCDGQADEGFDIGASCSTGVGACAGAGTKVCRPDGQGTMCNATSGEPAGERCGNGTDDDCDGQIDEGFDVGSVCSTGVGICARPGVKVCRADGLGTECGSTPGAPDPQGEVCGNGLDDDCDGEVDEGYDVGLSCSAGTGACVRWGVKICSADGRATTCGAEPGAPNTQGEVCGNGQDDDCDGSTDEGFDVGTACSVGTGTCQRNGTRVCRADGLGTQCSAVPGSPNGAGELCGNGLDDDCDGQADEGFDVGASCSAGVGACAEPGTRVCTLDGLGTMCNATSGQPTGERCGNGSDDDCDGQIDEGFDVGAVCSAGVGACSRQGVKVCRADGLGTQCGATAGAPDPQGEICGNGLDDDCDGQVDEGYDVGLSCSVGTGVCARWGVKVCSADGRATTCDAVAGTPNAQGEVCGNGQDDDCDGQADEGFDVGIACSVGTGTCQRNGTKMCRADGLGTQCSATPGVPNASGELCGNALDDDCDGAVDEGFDTGVVCSNGVGACSRPGVKVCRSDGLATVCNATPGTPNANGELCGNSQDDDCDGAMDEGFDTGEACANGVGVCETSGIKVCRADGLGTQCNAMPGFPEPAGELCGNNLDDDCDGTTDEGYDNGATCQMGQGICQRTGTMVCEADRLGTACSVQPGAPNPSGELCGNNLDDDCDASTDEGYDNGSTCSVGQGICLRTGTRVCSADRLSTRCDATPGTPDPSGERCGNSLDDDCDTFTDEGYDVGTSCTVGVGACQRTGARMCSADRLGTVCSATPGSPTTEVCGNGTDDDCDGQLDENCGPPVAVCTPEVMNAAPLAIVTLNGSGSSDPGGGMLTYNWVILSAPLGSTSDPNSPFSANSSFYVDLAGDYLAQLTVQNARGETDTCTVTIHSVPPQRLHVQLVWQEDHGDLDLLLTKTNEAPLGAFFDESAQEKACWWRNMATEWGVAGGDGNASLDIDDTAGNGPENINIATAPAIGDYYVGVHSYCDQSIISGGLSGPRGPLNAKVRIYCEGLLADEIPLTYRAISVGQLWVVARVTWNGTGCTVSRTDSMEWAVKYCKAVGGCAATANDCVPSRGCSSNTDCRAFETCQSNICRLNNACTSNSNCTSGMTCQAQYGNLCAR